MVITLIDKHVAQVGYRFIHLGEREICNQCPLKKVCVEPLEVYHTYEIIEIKKKEHTCLIDDTIMRVVDVKEVPQLLSVEKKKYLENLIITRPAINCSEELCVNYDYCMNPLFKKEAKVKIVKVLEEVECPLGYKLVLVEGYKVSDD
ncbi:MAG: UPF0179 family protein [Candidatus Heimdallarchaeaceae archaeon]